MEKKKDGQTYNVREAVYGMVYNSKGQIGIMNTPNGHFLPGGGIEEGECHSECLKREFLEETGHKIEIGNFIGCGILYDYVSTVKDYYKMIGYFYKVILKEQSKLKNEPEHELIWLNPAEAENTMSLDHQAWAIHKDRMNN